MTLWSPFQTAVFDFCANGKGHLVVEALAGTGKSTTLVEALNHFKSSKTKLVVAFNKTIAEEMKRKVDREGVSRCDVMTLHSYGLRQLGSNFRGVRLQIDGDKVHDRARQIFPQPMQRPLRDALKKVVGMVKNQLLPITHESVEACVFEGDLLEGSEALPGFATFTESCLSVLNWCADPMTTESIDFDDMIWLPVYLGVRCWQHDVVLVDETQDLNKTQLELAKMACKPGGRIVACGDKYQGIYAFRGADENAIDNIIADLGATVLPLNITYRCPKAVVREANKYVPALMAAPDAKEGLVRSCDEETMIQDVGPNDFIISRTNAPLVKLCLGFFKANRRATIQGKDIGKSLLALVDSSHRQTVADFVEWLGRWEAKKIEKLLRKDSDADTTPITDKADCLRAIAEGALSIEEMRSRAENLFSDQGNASAIVLTTTHKAKGLERPRVFMLMNTFRPQMGGQEVNLTYVAITRAQDELVQVWGEKK